MPHRSLSGTLTTSNALSGTHYWTAIVFTRHIAGTPTLFVNLPSWTAPFICNKIKHSSYHILSHLTSYQLRRNKDCSLARTLNSGHTPRNIRQAYQRRQCCKRILYARGTFTHVLVSASHWPRLGTRNSTSNLRWAIRTQLKPTTWSRREMLSLEYWFTYALRWSGSCINWCSF